MWRAGLRGGVARGARTWKGEQEEGRAVGAEKECVRVRREGQEYGFADFRQFRGGGHTTTRVGTGGR